MDYILRQYFKIRQKRIQKVAANPQSYQGSILERILSKNKACSYGQMNSFASLNSYKDYCFNVPLINYEDIATEINSMLEGKQNILCSNPVHWFAKSSGTSNNRSKFIPVTIPYLTHGHLRCAWDAASIIYNEDASAKLFKDRSLIMGGSLEKISDKVTVGDISAIILHHFPKIGRKFYTPDFETALLDDWEQKIDRIAEITKDQDVTLMAGVPTWVIVLFKAILEKTGKSDMSEVWPNLRSFLHGGVNFEPYRTTFQKYLPSEKVIYREVYNASEGYFALQNNKDEDGMLLLCNHELFYEFIPENQINVSSPETFTIDQLEKSKVYELVITNSSGLYRYRMNDLLEIVSINPVKVKVAGRTQQQLNAFGEELSIDNVSKALAKTTALHNSEIHEFTVAPVVMTESHKGYHDWFIEFVDKPSDITAFKEDLDKVLQDLNSDYAAKRSFDLAVLAPKINVLPNGTFEKWYRSKGKYGGQNKVPRLRNDRTIIDEILALI